MGDPIITSALIGKLIVGESFHQLMSLFQEELQLIEGFFHRVMRNEVVTAANLTLSALEVKNNLTRHSLLTQAVTCYNRGLSGLSQLSDPPSVDLIYGRLGLYFTYTILRERSNARIEMKELSDAIEHYFFKIRWSLSNYSERSDEQQNRIDEYIKQQDYSRPILEVVRECIGALAFVAVLPVSLPLLWLTPWLKDRKHNELRNIVVLRRRLGFDDSWHDKDVWESWMLRSKEDMIPVKAFPFIDNLASYCNIPVIIN